MANFKKVNQYIKTNFPGYKIEAVRGDCYVYFDGNDGFDKIESIYGVHPVNTSTEDMVQLVLEQIQDYLLSEGLPLEKQV